MTPEQLREKLQHDLKIVDQFLELAKRNNVSLTFDALNGNKHNGSANGSALAYGVIGPAVVDAIKACGKRYDVQDIRKRLSKAGKDISSGQIATALRRFAKQGKVKKVQEGLGRRTAKYETISL
jgi:hypothetical protein